MSEAFENEESDDESNSDCDDVCGLEEEDDKQRPFEDRVGLKMLVDSGSALDLISGIMARKLKKMGCTLKAATKRVRIKVANGKRKRVERSYDLEIAVWIR